MCRYLGQVRAIMKQQFRPRAANPTDLFHTPILLQNCSPFLHRAKVTSGFHADQKSGATGEDARSNALSHTIVRVEKHRSGMGSQAFAEFALMVYHFLIAYLARMPLSDHAFQRLPMVH